MVVFLVPARRRSVRALFGSPRGSRHAARTGGRPVPPVGALGVGPVAAARRRGAASPAARQVRRVARRGRLPSGRDDRRAAHALGAADPHRRPRSATRRRSRSSAPGRRSTGVVPRAPPSPAVAHHRSRPVRVLGGVLLHSWPEPRGVLLRLPGDRSSPVVARRAAGDGRDQVVVRARCRAGRARVAGRSCRARNARRASPRSPRG